MNRQGRALDGSAAYPEPPRLSVPAEVREAVDAVEKFADVDTDEGEDQP